jgi:hypothetical protein
MSLLNKLSRLRVFSTVKQASSFNRDLRVEGRNFWHIGFPAESHYKKLWSCPSSRLLSRLSTDYFVETTNDLLHASSLHGGTAFFFHALLTKQVLSSVSCVLWRHGTQWTKKMFRKGEHCKVVLVLRKVAWADSCFVIVITQGSAHATFGSTRPTLEYCVFLSFVFY